MNYYISIPVSIKQTRNISSRNASKERLFCIIVETSANYETVHGPYKRQIKLIRATLFTLRLKCT